MTVKPSGAAWTASPWHPHHLVVRGSVEQAGPLLHAGGGVPVLASARAPDRSTQRLGHGLEAVADTQDRDSGVEDGRVDGWGAVGVDRRRAAGEDDGRRPPVQHGGSIHGVGHDLGVDAGLAHAAGDELGVLRAEVHHEDRADGAGRSLAGRHPNRIAGAAASRLLPCRCTRLRPPTKMTGQSCDHARQHRAVDATHNRTRPVAHIARLPLRSRFQIKTTMTQVFPGPHQDQ